MNTAIQTFTSEKFGQLRTVEVNGETYFVGKDVANALGYANTKNAIAAHVYDDDKTTALIQGTGSNYKSKAVIINESGLFALILGSKLKQAQEFKHWITSEVLPTIRKTGSYTIVSENSNAALVTITPSMAAEMLKGNIGNRKLNQAAINRIATDMLMGNYVVNGTTIKVYKDGTLADGQHRLAACCKANVPFTTYIIRNLDKGVLPTIDCGRPRSLVDTLNMTGCAIQKKLVPAMNTYFAKGSKLTASQAATLWNAYEDKFVMLCDALAGGHHDFILSQSSVRSYLIHLAVSENWSEEDIRSFITGIKDKPNRDTAFELSCYNFRNFYTRKIHGKLRDLKSAGERTKTNVTIDALCSLAESFKSDRVISKFVWKNRARNILNTGYGIATKKFVAIETENQNRLQMR